jgi:hypothetical protein
MRTLGERLSLAGVALIVIALAVFGWIGYELSKWPGEPPQSASLTTGEGAVDEESPDADASADAEPSPGPSQSPTTPAQPQRVALLSDGLAITDGSWFNRVVRGGTVDGALPGAIASEAGLSAAELAPRAEQAARADILLVQAGTIDLLNGAGPNELITDLQDLLQTAIDLGGPDGGPEVVWVTVPPLDAQPSNVLTVNEAVTTWAEENGVTVWDLTTPVATGTGAWRPGFSAEGIAPAIAGQEAQARAARALAKETLAELAAG